jgi:hypothetical protein
MSVKAWVFGALGVIALGIWTAAASHLFMFFAGL